MCIFIKSLILATHPPHTHLMNTLYIHTQHYANLPPTWPTWLCWFKLEIERLLVIKKCFHVSMKLSVSLRYTLRYTLQYSLWYSLWHTLQHSLFCLVFTHFLILLCYFHPDFCFAINILLIINGFIDFCMESWIFRKLEKVRTP